MHSDDRFWRSSARAETPANLPVVNNIQDLATSRANRLAPSGGPTPDVMTRSGLVYPFHCRTRDPHNAACQICSHQPSVVSITARNRHLNASGVRHASPRHYRRDLLLASSLLRGGLTPCNLGFDGLLCFLHLACSFSARRPRMTSVLQDSARSGRPMDSDGC
jgi:hypothetical protein